MRDIATASCVRNYLWEKKKLYSSFWIPCWCVEHARWGVHLCGYSIAGHAGACVLALLRAEGSCVCDRGIQETETQEGSHAGPWKTHAGACPMVSSST